MNKADAERELDKVRDVLRDCETYFTRHAEHNAALHRSDRVLYSPLCVGVIEARASFERLAAELTGSPVVTGV